MLFAITGGKEFVGSGLAALHRERGDPVRLLTRLANGLVKVLAGAEAVEAYLLLRTVTEDGPLQPDSIYGGRNAEL